MMLTRIIILLLLVFKTCLCLSQEVCNNGIDDDGDGLIDLNDNECSCSCFTLTSSTTSLFPNQSFEDFTECPYLFGYDQFISDWFHDITDATTDYQNICAYVLPLPPNDPVLNFPDGDGVTGTIIMNNYIEYFGSKLTQPLQAGHGYNLQINTATVAFNEYFYSFYNDSLPLIAPYLDVVIWGSQDTSIPDHSNDFFINCIPYPNWEQITSFKYIPKGIWEENTVAFTPNKNYNSIIIGGPCIFPPNYINLYNSINKVVPYYFWDNARLNTESEFTSRITPIGSWCDSIYFLQAEIDTNNVTYQWYLNGIALNQEINSILNVNTYGAGEYTVVFYRNGKCQVHKYKVNPMGFPVPPYFNIVGNSIICPGDTLHLNALGNNDFYIWNNTEIISLSPNNNSVAIVPDSSFSILVSTSLNGCKKDTLIQIEISPVPEILFDAKDTICETGLYTFNYQTDPNNIVNLICVSAPLILPSFQAPSSFNISNPITSTYLMTVSNSQCSISDTFDLFVFDSLDLFQGQLLNNYVYAPISIGFQNLSIPLNSSYNYSWDFGNGQSIVSSLPYLNSYYSDSGTYLITLTSSIDGLCAKQWTDTLYVLNKEDEGLIVPNIFTPNGDGTNDNFILDVEKLSNLKFEIYNRWGESIVILDEKSNSWNGKVDNLRVSEGVYFYSYSARTKKGNNITGKGFLQIFY